MVDGRLTASALIEDCERLTSYHTEIPAHAKDVVLTALRACHEANRKRNRVILGSGWDLVEDQLRRELGRDIST